MSRAGIAGHRKQGLLGGLARVAAVCVLPAILCALLAPAGAAAATIAGTWSCCGSGGASAQTWTIAEAAGSLSGTASQSTPFSPISGSVSGMSVTIVTGPYTNDPSYTATFVGTIAANGETMSGTWSSNAKQTGTWTATRTSPPSKEQEEQAAAAKKVQEEKEKAEKEAASGKRKPGIQVTCDTFDPSLTTEYFQCTAQLGDASGRSPAERPSGTVTFAVEPGGGGGFVGSNACTLTPSQTGGASSFCAVEYKPRAQEAIPLGAQPPIVASYGGDVNFSAIAGKPSGPAARMPLTEANVYEALCKGSSFVGCEGHDPTQTALTQLCVSLLGCGSGCLSAVAAGCENPSGEVTGQLLTLSDTEPSVVAEVDCPPDAPVTEGPLTNCELEMLFKGSTDPALKAKAEYYEQYKKFSAQLNQIKIETVGTVESALAIDSGQRVGEPDDVYEKNKNSRKAEALAISKKAEEYYEELSKAGTLPTNEGPTYDVGKTCAVYKYEGCEEFFKAINNMLETGYKVAREEKIEHGVAVPFKLPTKASASASAVRRGRRLHEHPGPRGTLLAYASHIIVAAGTHRKVRLVVPSYARANLKRFYARGLRTLHAKLFVQVKLSTGGATTKVTRLTVHLVAHGPATRRRGSKRSG